MGGMLPAADPYVPLAQADELSTWEVPPDMLIDDVASPGEHPIIDALREEYSEILSDLLEPPADKTTGR
jgi:hypothetical protein